MKIRYCFFILFMIAAVQQLAAQSVIYYIAPNKADCVGIATSKCYLVKKSADAAYSFFYGEIVGFTYEEGYEYKLKIKIENIENPPADAPKQKYILEEVLEKTKAIAVNTDLKIQQKWNLYKFQKSNHLIKTSSKAFIEFTKDARISGNTSCNSFFGSYTQKENKLAFSQVGMTKMYCEGSIENDFMASFNKVNTYKISKKYLYLYHDTELLMMFVKAK